MTKPAPQPLPDPDDPVQQAIVSGQFWVFRTESPEWHYVLQNTIIQFFGADISQWYGCGVSFDDVGMGAFYLLGKQRVPVGVLSYRLGVPVEILKKASLVTLHPIAGEGPPQPTVSYWGTC